MSQFTSEHKNELVKQEMKKEQELALKNQELKELREKF